ncbi:hypothetical protein GQ600_9542 [Phytophthora cactorum]|nr:hypothetical protein GQ600_9542 [Phytophthora cactorum]
MPPRVATTKPGPPPYDELRTEGSVCSYLTAVVCCCGCAVARSVCHSYTRMQRKATPSPFWQRSTHSGMNITG